MRQLNPHPQRLIRTKTQAYLLGRVEQVMVGELGEVAPAPEGRYVLIEQVLRPPDKGMPTFGEVKLWLYDAQRRTLKLLHRMQDAPQTRIQQGIGSTLWFPKIKRALVTQTVTRLGSTPTDDNKISAEQYGICDLERGTLRWLKVPPELSYPQEISGLPGLLFHGKLREPQVTDLFTVLSSEGSFSPFIKIPNNPYPKSMSTSVSGVSRDGKQLFLETALGKGKVLWQVAELRTGVVTPLKERPREMITDESVLEEEERTPKPPLTLFKEMVTIHGSMGRTELSSALWLEAQEPLLDKKYTRALIVSDVDRVVGLLPDLSAILYTHDKALYALPVAALTKTELEEFLKDQALNNARQAEQGLVRYTRDHAGSLPQTPLEVNAALLRFIPNPDQRAEFVYLYTISEMSLEQRSSERTIWGYFPTQSGRAIIYGNGDVKWE